MKLAMLGITGVVGARALDLALERGHEVTALVRDRQKVNRVDPRLHLVDGDALDHAAVTNTIAGADAVVSTLGGTRGPESLSEGTSAVLAAMTERDVHRLVVAQGFHLFFEGDPGNFGQRLAGLVMKTALRKVAQHSEQLRELLLASTLDWTLVRMPPVKTGQPLGSYDTGILRLGPWNKVRDVDAADYLLACLDDPTTIRAAPMIVSR
jgi:putative NADH-flavin reductase